MTREEAIRMLERLKDRINFEVTDSQQKMDALNMAIRSLENDRTIEKVLYAIREEMQFIKVAELQIYGKQSWGFTKGIEGIINEHLKGVENGADR